MNDELLPDVLKLPETIRLVAGFLSSLILTWVSIPTIVKISKFKKLFDVPNKRTSHLQETPTLGGLAVFSGFTVSIIIFSHISGAFELLYIVGGLIPLFFIGIKDDILIIDPKKKVFGQILSSLMVIWIGGIRITNFHNVLGLDSLSPLSSILFTVFLFLVLINGLNLIDGIDGLASAIGILITLFYGAWFILTGYFNYGIIAVSLTGSLASFFCFNVFGKENKIFLGDTGSTIIGFIIAVLTVKFLECNLLANEEFRIHSAPAIAISFLIIPLFDTFRVFILRIMNGKSPFQADRNHMHHLLLSLGISHLKATVIIISVNLFIISIVFIFRNLGVVMVTVLMLVIIIFFSLILKQKIGHLNQ